MKLLIFEGYYFEIITKKSNYFLRITLKFRCFTKYILEKKLLL